jgi:hypothetical protein
VLVQAYYRPSVKNVKQLVDTVIPSLPYRSDGLVFVSVAAPHRFSVAWHEDAGVDASVSRWLRWKHPAAPAADAASVSLDDILRVCTP